MTHITRKQEILAGARNRIVERIRMRGWTQGTLARKARVSPTKLVQLLEAPIDTIQTDRQVLHRLIQFSKTDLCPWGYFTTRLLRWSRDFEQKHQ